MALFKPDTPQPPNPIQTAAASTSTNVATGVANAFLNNVNQITPQGKLSYSNTSNYSWADPVTGQTYSIPQFTATQEYDPYTRDVINPLNQATQYNLAEAGKQGSFDIMHLLQGENDPRSGAPRAGDINSFYNNPEAQTSFGGVGDQQRSLGYYGQQQGGFDYAGAQQGQFADAGQQQTGFGGVPGQMFGFGGAGDVTRGYGPADNFSADRGRVEEALYGRLNPQLERERAGIEQKLADQGIRYGSAAYTRAMDDYSRQANDARLAVTQTAGQEQQRMMDMAAQEAGFQNAAQQQQYLQQQGRGQFYNQAQQAAFGQEATRGQFANQAQQAAFEQAKARGQFANVAQEQAFKEAQARGQFANEAQMNAFQQQLQSGTFANQAQKDAFQQEATRAEFANAGLAQNMARDQQIFGNENQLRSQYMNENYAQRNQQFNEITALLSGSQISQPNFVSTNQNQIAGTDVAGLINNRFSQEMDTYKQQSANFNSLMGGIFGAMGGMVKSDRREKENIEKVGTVFAAGPDSERELPIYAYDYKKDDPDGERHVGPMAQDVEKIDKRAVSTRKGVKFINTTRMGSIMKVA